MDYSILINWTSPFLFLGLSHIYLIKIPVDKKCVDPDQMPRSAASDLGLHCLPMSKKWDARLIWVNGSFLYTVRIGPVCSCDL